jgi:hypothetical protein
VKNVVFIIILLVIQFTAQAQKKFTVDFTTSLGSGHLLKTRTGTDAQALIYSQTNLWLNVLLANNWHVSTGLGYESSIYVIDGVFTKVGNDYFFDPVPAGYTQNKIVLDYITVPLLVKHNFGTKNNQLNLGFGPIIGFLSNARQVSKIDGQKYSADAPIQRKVRYGLNLDFDYRKRNEGNKISGILGGGILYQLTNHLEHQKTFLPLVVYIRFGFGS